MSAQIPKGMSEARQYFEEQQLDFPFIPSDRQAEIKCLQSDVYATIETDDSPYDLPAFLNKALSEKVNDYFLFGFAGHGVSSRVMHYYAVSDHLVLLFQKGFGNGQKNTTKERDEINGVFHSAKIFFEAMKEAVDKGKIPEGRRLVVIVSDIKGSGWGWVDGTPGKIPESDWHVTKDFLQALDTIPDP